MFGFLIIAKPIDWTSHDVVSRVRRLLPRKTKVGHAGTLDPFADGVLVLGVGQATRLLDEVHHFPKTYRTTVTLGATSDTGDCTGEITPTPGDCSVPTAAEIEAALEPFRGEIDQVPPAHSAIHINGRRAYELARAGEAVEMPTRRVTIHELTLLRAEGLEVELEITCSTGTYIRAIARDLGEALGLGGYCSQLCRTAIGPFALTDGAEVETLTAEEVPAALLAPTMALTIPTLTLSEEDITLLRHGKQIPWPEPISSRVALLDESGALLALAQPGESPTLLQPKKVFCINP
ncbi:MAG: tRNA pseudouridine(55) synthase TruB [Phycisphaerales bacterium]|jgi:tRNA pseudouridine55 synthase|nr:tRNA pseudouridine(55) synthase TruB [Phycisphaerales bacterium]MBT7170566.1 tRNA pseudouridine(55) synthase TruB [Phycisphaerales bacterium]